MNIFSNNNKKIHKVMKLINILVVAFVLSIIMVFPAYAANNQKVVDDADILTDSEEKSLTTKINNFIEKNQLDIVLVTTNDYGADIELYADNFYRDNGYGSDGLIMVIGFNPNKITIIPKGNGEKIYTNYGCKIIRESITDYFTDKEYSNGFNEFIEYADDFYKEAKDDEPYSVNHKYKSTADKVKAVVIIFGVSLAIALITVFVMVKKMNNISLASEAAEYIKRDSLNIRKSQDIFLYRNVTKTRRESDNNGGNSSSGGSGHSGSTGSF